MKAVLWMIMGLLLSIGNGVANEPSKEGADDKTMTIDIPADLPLPPSAEEVAPTHPFFAAPSPDNEVMEKLQELEERVEKLEKSMPAAEKESE